MYIYDRKLSGSQSRSKEQSTTSQPVQRNIYHPDRTISGSSGRGGSSSSYVWANEGLGQLSTEYSLRSHLSDSVGSLAMAQPPTTRLPRVMFEFDVHYGFRDVIDQRIGQTVPSDRLTKHDKRHDFFNVKLDWDRLEIGTERFDLDSQGLKNIEQVKKNIVVFADLLEKGCKFATEKRNIKIPGVVGHPRLFPLPNARTSTSSLLVHKLHINRKFPSSKDECGVWASPQAHITIPLAKVAQLIDEIKKSIGKPPGHALTGGKLLPSGSIRRMGLRSDHLYKAKEGVESLRKAMLTWNHKLSNGVLVDSSTFSDQLSGFLMLQASYLWVIKLWQREDKEFFGKGHLPINVKTPFPEIFSKILTPTEQLIYKELFAGPTIRYRMFGLVEDSPTLAHGSQKLFPPPVSSSLTWDDLLDWTLGLPSPISGLPGGGTKWAVSETSPLVALELRRVGLRPMDTKYWGTFIDTIVDLTKCLN